MKKLILILFLFSTTFAATKKTLKQQLRDCQTSKTYIDTIYLNIEPTKPKKAAKISKQEQKTKRLELKQITEREKIAANKEVKQAKSENRKEIKTDLFRNFTKMITKSVWALGLYTMIGFVIIRLFEGFIKSTPLGAIFKK